MFVGCAFMEEKECGHFFPFDLDHECVSLSMLVFVLHENLWEYDSCCVLWIMERRGVANI
jgi:hypothetical protein